MKKRLCPKKIKWIKKKKHIYSQNDLIFFVLINTSSGQLKNLQEAKKAKTVWLTCSHLLSSVMLEPLMS